MDCLYNLLFPSKCVCCKKLGESLCIECIKTAIRLKKTYCVVCGRESEKGVTHESCRKLYVPRQFCAYYEYSGTVRTCVKASKYNKKLFSCLKTLTLTAFSDSKFMGMLHIDKNFIVIPIPLSKRKEKDRGFNQAVLIAEMIGRFYKLKTASGALKRIIDTKTQVGHGRKERFENINGAFRAEKKLTVNQKILLVDDICTSGATFLEASKTLFLSGAKDVVCFSLSRTPV